MGTTDVIEVPDNVPVLIGQILNLNCSRNTLPFLNGGLHSRPDRLLYCHDSPLSVTSYQSFLSFFFFRREIAFMILQNMKCVKEKEEKEEKDHCDLIRELSQLLCILVM